MLDWTGERFVPWAREPAVAYEHLHRYIWASSLVKDKRVLDLASGEGYGTDILARQAAFVCGVDIAEAAVQHASKRYIRPNLQFLRGSLTQVPIPGEKVFDLIVCFEAIEHVREHDELMCEVKRLLKPEGIFVVSTPNKEAYREGEPPNPFHVRELTFKEFNALLTRYFSIVRYFGQRVYTGSSMWPVGPADGSPVQEFTIEHVNDEFQQLDHDKRTPMYFVAVASDADVSARQGSVLLDHSDELVHARDREVRALNERLNHSAAHVQQLQAAVAEQESALRQQAREVERLEVELVLGRRELAAIQESRGWKLVLKIRALKAWLGRLVYRKRL